MRGDNEGPELDNDLQELMNRARNLVAICSKDWVIQQMQGVLQQGSAMSQKGVTGGGGEMGRQTQQWGVTSGRPVAGIVVLWAIPQEIRVQERMKSTSPHQVTVEEGSERDSEHERWAAPVARPSMLKSPSSRETAEGARENGGHNHTAARG
ncbi:hypothetical protein NDU88_002177 [Pleurodeles waltl]|uniref:Uncharacterized protein n=1 Tax=Pleurodeles waltl TaxID=8319 RepID=A0AAV7VYM9_PLEWA|nr:hypothetical protein NDU88_002177 [Pleurodeles waltl]